MSTLALDGIIVKTVSDDIPYKEIEPHSYQIYACELAYTYTLKITEDGPCLTPFHDQKGRKCVEDTDGTIYRIKDS